MLENPEITIDYTLSYRDFVAGQKFASRQNIFTLVINFLARYVATTLVGLILLVIVLSHFHGPRVGIVGLLPVLIPLALMPIAVWYGWRVGFNKFKDSPTADPRMTFQADKSSFVRRVHNMGELTWLWSATAGIRTNKKVVLVVARKGAFIFIPRRSITDAEISVLKEMWQSAKVGR